MASSKLAVVGGGAWGLALAAAAARAGTDVLLHSRRTHDGDLPAGVRTTKDMAAVGKHARLVVLAVPTAACRAVARELGDHLDGGHYVVHGIRGLEHRDGTNGAADLHTVSDVIRDETPVRRTGALGGPALASDLLAGRASVLVTGSRYPEVNEAVTAALSTPTLRVYPTQDLRGLEWASALVGCLTIAVGYAQALGVSPGLVAALITRAIGEASRIAAAAGGDEHTLLGLAGYGDLLASISQDERPEVLLGRALARGSSVADATKAAKLRVEAVDLIPRVSRWADTHAVRSPIFRALAGGILEGTRADAILNDLMTLPILDRA